MPAAVKEQAVLVSLEINSPGWKVIEGVRGQFVTHVTNKDGSPKVTKAGVQQVRKERGDEILRRVVEAVLLNASEETLAALADEAVDKPGAGGKEPRYKAGDFIRSIVAARVTSKPVAVDITKLSDEELAAELERRKALQKAGKSTKDVVEV
jgi:methylaspartate ammonia-lyase